MKLLIISDTPMYGPDSNDLEVFEPTLREIESVSPLFRNVLWVGYWAGPLNPGNARRPNKNNIQLSLLPLAIGGETLFDKFKMLPRLPALLLKIYNLIKKFEIVHSRGPSVPAFICIIFSFFFREKKFWHKYAGNWMEPSPPFMYAVQKKLLIKAKHSICTINGQWPKQPSHIVSLENPCFTEREWEEASKVSMSKTYDVPLILCFTGLVSESKGILTLLKGLSGIQNLGQRVSKLIIVGNGPAMEQARLASKELLVPAEFTGYLQRKALNEVYAISHILILPSKTEGFPKVVAEAAAFGCVPVVTNVSAIGQYIRNGKNGFLLTDNQAATIKSTLEGVLLNENLAEISKRSKELSKLFTYERFFNSVKKILSI